MSVSTQVLLIILPGTYTRLGLFNFEYLVNKDPEYIFVINRNTIVGSAEENTTSDMMENELIKKTTAYKNNRIIYLNTVYWYTISGGYNSTMSMIEEVEKVFYLQEKK